MTRRRDIPPHKSVGRVGREDRKEKNMRIVFGVVVAGLLGGCVSYITPGGLVRLGDINRADIAQVASRKPAASFPARLAVARVQAADYRFQSTQSLATGRFSVVTTQELMPEEDFQHIGNWPGVAGVAPINPLSLLLPDWLEALDHLRVSAAKVQVDVLLVYTVDTSFRVLGRGYGPLVAISLGLRAPLLVTTGA